MTETGRTMVEIIAVLAIIAILSMGGFWWFSSSNQERQVNDIIYHMNLQIAQIYPALQQAGGFSSAAEMNRFLAPYRVTTGNYVLNFVADPNSDGKDFVTQITKKNGEQIKGKECRSLISKMSKLKMAQDISFSLKDEEMEDGSLKDVTVPLNDRIVDFSAMCG